MNNRLRQRKKIIRTFFLSSLLTVGLGNFQFRQSRAQVIWKPIDTPKAKTSPVIWETNISGSAKQRQAPTKWEIVPEAKFRNQSPSGVVWEVLETEDDALILPSQTPSNSVVIPPSSLEEAEALLGIIPLKPSDYQPLLRLSPLVSTAETLPMEQWRIAFGTISPFESDTGTGNQNYSVNLDIGFNDSLLLSLFVSQALEEVGTELHHLRRCWFHKMCQLHLGLHLA